MNTLSFRLFSRVLLVSMAFVVIAFIVSCQKDEVDTNASSNNTVSLPNDTYPSVVIGSQEWMIKNLSVANYADGTPIPQVTDPTEWANTTIGAWCWYNNDIANEVTYGRLYNWYAVAGIYDSASKANPALRKKLAPSGWHVPTDTEWTLLTDFLGGLAEAGGEMKTTGTIEAVTGLWYSPNADATNSSGFLGVPGGYRNAITGEYYGLGYGGDWWSSSERSNFDGWDRVLIYSDGFAYVDFSNKESGSSVRCIKD